MSAPLRRFSVFVDESSQTKHRYLTLGCLVVDQRYVNSFDFTIAHARQLELPSGEMKWVKISASKLNVYKLVVDRFFDLPQGPDSISFHSLVVDTSKIRDDLYNDGDRELGFNKEVYQLLMKCARLYPDGLFNVFADERQTKRTMEELRIVLNNGMKKKGDTRILPFRNVQFCDSKKFRMLQMADLLLGAATFQINGHHQKENASAHKCHLSEYILGRAGVRDPMKNTAVRGKFTIWHRRLR